MTITPTLHDIPDRCLVTGAGGLVGRALVENLRASGNEVIALNSRADCDLTNSKDVHELFQSVRPTKVYHLAAAVFGVGGNLAFPGAVFYRNTMMNTNTVEACRQAGVNKIVAMGSAAMYADGLQQPMKEEDVMFGEPHGSEYAYAHSKRAMLAQLKAYQQQYGLSFALVIATNMYGPGDRFDPQYGHVVPSLLKKFLDAEITGSEVEIWGDGSPTRDFLYSTDAARGLQHIMAKGIGPINLATGKAYPIKSLVAEITKHFPSVPYRWDTEKPLGQIKRAYDVQRASVLGFSPSYSLEQGIAETVEWLRANSLNLRH